MDKQADKDNYLILLGNVARRCRAVQDFGSYFSVFIFNNILGGFMKQKVTVMCLVMSATLAASCATMHKSLLTGVSVGVSTGVVSGSAISRGEGVIKGAIVGAAIGAASSYLIHKALQKRDSKTRRQTLLNLDKFSVSAPTRGQGVQDFRLSAPDVDKECFDWEVRGNQLVQQHCVWTIQGNSSWLPSTRRRK